MTQYLNHCPTCHQVTDKREINMFDGLVTALSNVFKWCVEKNKFEFSRREVKHLFTNENQSARFGDWVLFGGLVYRPEIEGKTKKGFYGINKERARAFFAGDYSIPKKIIKNPVTGELEKLDYVTIHQMPRLIDLLDENLRYIHPYHEGRLL